MTPPYDDEDQDDDAASPRVGALVRHEPSGRVGIVLDEVTTHADGTDLLDADGSAYVAHRVAWLPEVSDPIPAADLRAP